MKLHHFFMSSASYRVRIALQLKGVAWDSVPVNLRASEQLSPEFARTNAAMLVPVLEDDGRLLSQSLAIIEYLDERFPDPPLLPRGAAADRAFVRQIALSIACDIHPLNNLRVLKYLGDPLGHEEATRNTWYRNWVNLGFAALEQQLAASPHRGTFCFGDAPTLADVCLVPQIANAARVQTDMTPYPTLVAIDRACSELEAFQKAHPKNWAPPAPP